jgi:UDP-glucuronate 4-epimerase
MHVVELLEKALGRTAEKEFLPPQAGDVAMTWAAADALERATGFRPRVTVEEGVPRFVAWYRQYYGT